MVVTVRSREGALAAVAGSTTRKPSTTTTSSANRTPTISPRFGTRTERNRKEDAPSRTTESEATLIAPTRTNQFIPRSEILSEETSTICDRVGDDAICDTIHPK